MKKKTFEFQITPSHQHEKITKTNWNLEKKELENKNEEKLCCVSLD